MIVTLSKDNFQAEVADYKGTVVVLFTDASDPLPVQVEGQVAQNVKFGTVDFNAERELVHKFSIRRLPLFLKFVDGRVHETANSFDKLTGVK